MAITTVSELEEVCRRRVGNVVDERYHLVELLGFGTTGAVYKAENRWVGRSYALKLFHYQGTDQHAVLRRFVREAQAGNRILRSGMQHPNVVQSYDVGRDSNTRQFFIVQELLPGQTLAHHLYALPDHSVPYAEAYALFKPVIDAMACAHEVGIVHRDLKPENVFLSKVDGVPVPKVLDFGIAQLADARMTPTHELLGTPQYMPPEAFSGARAVDARADVWALALILYEIISGSCPFESEGGPIAAMKKIQVVRPVSLAATGHVSPQVWSVIHRALSKDMSLRQHNARELLEALESAESPVRVLRVPAKMSATDLQALLQGRNSQLNDSRHGRGEGDVTTFSRPPPGDPAQAFWSVEFLASGHTAHEIVEILNLPELSRRVELHVVNNPLDDDGIAVLSGSSALVGVSSLVLRRVGLTPGAVRRLVNGPHADGISRLDFEDNPLDAIAVEAIMSAPNMASLRALSLVKTGIDDDAMAVLAASAQIANLTRLDLSQNHITDVGFEQLGATPNLSPDLWLGVARNLLGPRAPETALGLKARIKKLVT